MNESELGYNWDISFEGVDVVFIDGGESVISLTESDLRDMLEELTGG